MSRIQCTSVTCGRGQGFKLSLPLLASWLVVEGMDAGVVAVPSGGTFTAIVGSTLPDASEAALGSEDPDTCTVEPVIPTTVWVFWLGVAAVVLGRMLVIVVPAVVSVSCLTVFGVLLVWLAVVRRVGGVEAAVIEVRRVVGELVVFGEFSGLSVSGVAVVPAVAVSTSDLLPVVISAELSGATTVELGTTPPSSVEETP